MQRIALAFRGFKDTDDRPPWETQVVAQGSWLALKGVASMFWWLALVVVPLRVVLDGMDWSFIGLVAPLAFIKGAIEGAGERKDATRRLGGATPEAPSERLYGQ
jgi:hypothetical protein